LLEVIKTFATIDVPTLIVWGREEKSIPLAVGREMHKSSDALSLKSSIMLVTSPIWTIRSFSISWC
jgi:hypothetical protein